MRLAAAASCRGNCPGSLMAARLARCSSMACDAGADTIVTGCAYCLHMLEDSLKLLDRDDSIRVIDLGSLMLESLEEN